MTNYTKGAAAVISASPTGFDLAKWLRSGWTPTPIQAPFPLQPDETCVGVVDGVVEQWLEGDGSYVHKSVAWAGGVGGLALGAATSAIGNARRRAKAAKEAAERWRAVDNPRIYITNQRFAMQGRQWVDLWYPTLRTVTYDQAGVVVQTAGASAMRLRMLPPDYWFVLLRHLAYGEITDPQTQF